MATEALLPTVADGQAPLRMLSLPLQSLERQSPQVESSRKRPSESPEPQTARGETVRVKVVARVRPLLPCETVGPRKGANCTEVASPSVAVGKSCFTFDHVFGPEASQEEVYENCVEPLVEATLEGVNGTLFAYGQTGSGKTYTMGTSGLPSVPEGALQRALRAIFTRATACEGESVTFHVTFVEIFTDASRSRIRDQGTEEIRDLLSPGNSQIFAVIKADADGGIRLEGVVEYEVYTEKEALNLLSLGTASRATCATRMNDSSSRSHAIFSLEVVQRRLVSGVPSTLTSKFQFVDLAGSEKVKISGVEGEQLSQAININHGLFVLGKAITALTEGHPHVPFRESKLTRILQNSLGGNSRTCMLACVSPSDSNLAETISTLTYSAKAKAIKNKPVVNRGVSCPNCSILQSRIEALERDDRCKAAGQGRIDDASAKPPMIQSRARLPARQERFHTYVVELEKENVNLRQENKELRQRLEECETHKLEHGYSRRADTGSSSGFTGSTISLADAKELADTRAAAARAETLYQRCSERLAALQQAVQAAEVNVDNSLLMPEDAAINASDIDTYTLAGYSDIAGTDAVDASAELDGADVDVTWLDQEARRKQNLLLQVEANHHAMAVLQAQSVDRIRQHEAARDIAERELARLQAELDAANYRADKYRTLQ
jgi:hypothetical protein